MPQHEITPGFKGGPYTAKPSGGMNDWWYVENAAGANCLRIMDAGRNTGGKFTNEVTEKALAEKWNDGRN